MGLSMDVVSELQGPVDDYAVAPEGHRLVWAGDNSPYTAQGHPEIPDVSWSYGNLLKSWDQIIAQYPGSEAVARVGHRGILFADEVEAISNYLSAVVPLPEHGEDFAGRLRQLQELFARAAALPGGAVHTS